MKILQLLSNGSVGGTETFVISLVKGLIERGHQSTIVNTWTDSPVNEMAHSAGVPLVALPCGRRRIGVRWLRTVKKYLLEHDFDIVNTYGLRVSLGLRMLQRKCGVSHHVWASRGLEQQRTGFQAFLDRRTEHLVELIVCNAQAVAERRVTAFLTPQSKICVIPNGIDLSHFSADAVEATRESLTLPDGLLIANVASFRFEKDHENLLRALKIAGDELGNAKVLLIGAGSGQRDIEQEVRRMGLSRRVIFVGPVEDVRPYLKACDAFVLSSFSEGMPRALMEAMAMGLPVVSTTAGGIPEVAENETSALLVPTRSPVELAAALKRIVNDGDLRNRLGRSAARRIADHFSSEKMLDRYIEMYRSILGEPVRD